MDERQAQIVPEGRAEVVVPHQVLDGKSLAAKTRRQLAGEIQDAQTRDPSFLPGLAILQVGGREDSNVYIRMKTKAAREVGFTSSNCALFGTVLLYRPRDIAQL